MLSAVHYIVIDIVCVISLSYSVTLAAPLPSLGSARPTGSLLGPSVLASIAGQHLINLAFLGGALLHMRQHPAYVQWGPLTPEQDRPIVYSEGRAWWFLGDNWEVTVRRALHFCLVYHSCCCGFDLVKIRFPAGLRRGEADCGGTSLRSHSSPPLKHPLPIPDDPAAVLQVLFFCFGMQMVTAAISAGLGGSFRRPLWSASLHPALNCRRRPSSAANGDAHILAMRTGVRHRRANGALCLTSVSLYGMFVGMLLLPPSRLTAVLHIASIAFNSDGTANPVWQAFQAACPTDVCTSAGMPLAFRVELLAIIGCGNLAALAWEKLAVLGPLRTALHRAPRHSPFPPRWALCFGGLLPLPVACADIGIYGCRRAVRGRQDEEDPPLIPKGR